MELATLSKTYADFYAPAYAVRVGGEDLLRDVVVSVSQVEADLQLGSASRFSFTGTNGLERIPMVLYGRGCFPV